MNRHDSLQGKEPVCTLYPHVPAAFPGAGAAPKAAVCAAARAPAWSAVVVGDCCWSGQGVSPLGARRAARRFPVFLR